MAPRNISKTTTVAASQEITRISRNPKVHYRTNKRPPPVLLLGQLNSVHIPTSHLLEIHPNIIHQSTPRSPQWSLSLRFLHQDPIHPVSSPTRATCPAHLTVDHIKHIFLNIFLQYELIKLCVTSGRWVEQIFTCSQST